MQEIISEAVEIEKSFICDSLPVCFCLCTLFASPNCCQAVLPSVSADCSVCLYIHRCMQIVACSWYLMLQVALIGMNGELMGQYIEFVADRLLHVLGSEKIYKTKCPFEWMEQLSLQ